MHVCRNDDTCDSGIRAVPLLGNTGPPQPVLDGRSLEYEADEYLWRQNINEMNWWWIQGMCYLLGWMRMDKIVKSLLAEWYSPRIIFQGSPTAETAVPWALSLKYPLFVVPIGLLIFTLLPFFAHIDCNPSAFSWKQISWAICYGLERYLRGLPPECAYTVPI